MAKDLWEKLTVGLEDDERLVYPEVYLNNKKYYDKICGIAYLIRGKDGLDWVWESGLDRARDNGAEVLEKMLVVRIRLPWNEYENDWLIDKKEFDANRDEYEVLEVHLFATLKGKPHKVYQLDPIEYEMDRDNYDIVDAKYLVCWRAEPEEIKKLMEIPEYHSYISK